ncbi:MAG: bifunctional phosphoribosylaminoimidazolecarboxamide formyltransferase/inosine monophosphate cyclohydrolase [Deltaproteobacteria bacterium]|nr:MAG: bifunctional phosphoribosylaminoimidazolecarboxamide formyltransferase/inosine monophosphate cyclohydrolase [Deltaproteobacteria bacterium]
MSKITRALVSVSDKSGVQDLARGLAERGVEILSTGGTAKAIREAGVTVRDVSDFTASPEIMDGRVKTLHPRVHGGILMRDQDEDRAALESIGGAPIDLVVVNLYPFEATVARPDATHELIVENIDIGGPTMVRSAAKNHARVAVVVDPSDYGAVLEAIDGGGPDAAFRARLAAKAFGHTAAYDGAISGYLTSIKDDGSRDPFPGTLTLSLEKAYDCRYGENPHQQGAFYVERGAAAGSMALAESLGAGGKELSFNNIVDIDATLDAVREFTEQPAAVVVKHTNPAGVAVAEDLETAFRNARAADPVSAFGGIVALNREVDEATAKAVTESFIECIIAPAYVGGALDVLRKKKNMRILATGEMLPADRGGFTFKRVDGGVVVHERDGTGIGEVRAGRVATKRAPTDAEMRALDFAWRVCKHVKSNAIVFAHEDRTVGVGAGQMSRVVSVELAAKQAGDKSKGAVMASDAFFPFADGIEAAIAAGVTAVCQPGGSKRDDEVIAAADAAGIAMVLTGIRHFRH